MGRQFISLASLFAIAVSGSTALAGPAFENLKVEAGQKLFDAECHRCHADNASDPSYGPSLVGIIGRKAGSLSEYDYSDALKDAPIVWTEAALRAWIEDNSGFMPGTKMRHVGITDRTVQDFILSYLATLDG